MKRYACKADVFRGDIITVKEQEYIEYPGGAWSDHFIEKEKHYIVIDSMNSNNGNFRAKDSRGRIKHFNTIKDSIRVDRRKDNTAIYI